MMVDLPVIIAGKGRNLGKKGSRNDMARPREFPKVKKALLRSYDSLSNCTLADWHKGDGGKMEEGLRSLLRMMDEIIGCTINPVWTLIKMWNVRCALVGMVGITFCNVHRLRIVDSRSFLTLSASLVVWPFSATFPHFPPAFTTHVRNRGYI